MSNAVFYILYIILFIVYGVLLKRSNRLWLCIPAVLFLLSLRMLYPLVHAQSHVIVMDEKESVDVMLCILQFLALNIPTGFALRLGYIIKKR